LLFKPHVESAGGFLGKGIEESSLEEWHRLCEVNLTGPARAAR